MKRLNPDFSLSDCIHNSFNEYQPADKERVINALKSAGVKIRNPSLAFLAQKTPTSINVHSEIEKTMVDLRWDMKPNKAKTIMLAERQLAEFARDAVSLEGPC